MAGEDEIVEQVTQIAVSAGAGTMDIILYIVIAMVVIGAVFAFTLFLDFKHKVRLRYLTKDGSYIIDDKAKRVEEDGVVIWKLLKQRMSISPPPREAINITKKGLLAAECYITEDNPEPVWLLDKGYGEAQEGFLPLTTQQRSLTVSRIRKAESRKSSTLWEKISAVIMPVAMIIIVAIPFIFFGDITAAATESMEQNAAVSAQNAEIANQNARLLSVIAGKLDAGEIKVVQNIPPNAQEGGK